MKRGGGGGEGRPSPKPIFARRELQIDNPRFVRGIRDESDESGPVFPFARASLPITYANPPPPCYQSPRLPEGANGTSITPRSLMAGIY